MLVRPLPKKGIVINKPIRGRLKSKFVNIGGLSLPEGTEGTFKDGIDARGGLDSPEELTLDRKYKYDNLESLSRISTSVEKLQILRKDYDQWANQQHF